jgi:6-phospho-beta-glucosidase
MELYRDPHVAEKPALLEQRGGAFYSDAATQLVASLVADSGDTQVVDIRNGGALPGLAEDDVVEAPARVSGAGAVPLPQPPLAPELLGLIQHVAAYERLAAKAAASGDRQTAKLALMAHPLVREYRLAETILDRMLAAELDAALTRSGR